VYTAELGFVASLKSLSYNVQCHCNCAALFSLMMKT